MSDSIKKKYLLCFSLIAIILIVDQALKFWIKTHFAIGDSVDLIGDWCKLYFVENIGMAFGVSFGEEMGKLILTLFRFFASIGIIWLLVRMIKKDSRYTLIISVTLIFVGAVGNLIDSCFYGLLLSESTHDTVATFLPENGGYGSFLHGKVVDMWYFPILEWDWPSWMPWFGGKHCEFFSAIFNVADAAITVGIIVLFFDQLVCQFSSSEEDTEEVETPKEEKKVNRLMENTACDDVTAKPDVDVSKEDTVRDLVTEEHKTEVSKEDTALDDVTSETKTDISKEDTALDDVTK